MYKIIKKSFSTVSPRKCLDRKRFHEHAKILFEFNLKALRECSFKGSLKYSSLVLTNIALTNNGDENLLKYTKSNIREKIKQINPSLVLPLLISLRDTSTGEEADILKEIYNYVIGNYMLFELKDLKQIEHIYYLLDKKISLKFSPILSDKIKFMKEKFGGTQNATNLAFTKENIKLPKKVSVKVYNENSKINIIFNETGQRIQLFGVNHLEIEEMAELRKSIYENKRCNFFIFETVPFDLKDYEDIKKRDIWSKNEKEYKGKLIIPSFGGGSRDPENFLKQMESVHFLDNDLLKFYVEKMIVENKKDYTVHETQRIVYTEDFGVKKCDEMQTLLYILSKSNDPKIKVLFTDLPIIDEIFYISRALSVQELKDKIQFYRSFWLNIMVNWISKVSKSGCPKCSSSRTPPMDLINSFSPNDYDFSIREKNFAKKILISLAMNIENKEIAGFLGQDHLISVTKYICEILNEEPLFFQKFGGNFGVEEVNKEIEKVFRGDLAKVSDMGDEGAEEVINKCALIGSIMQKKKIVLPIFLKGKQQIFDYYHNEYNKLFTMESFGKEFKKSEQEKPCYASKLLLNE